MPFIFDLEVVSGSNHTKWELNHAGILICHMKEPGESEDANRQLIKLIAETLSLPHSKVEIVHGIESKKKMLKVTDYQATYEKLLNHLGVGVSVQSKKV